MQQVPRSHRGSNSGFGTLLGSGALGLAALVALGLGIYAWNSPEEGDRPEDRSRDAESQGTSATDGSISSHLSHPVPLPDYGPASDGTTVADRAAVEDPSLPSLRASWEDLSDVERPVSYVDAEARFGAGDYAGASRFFAAYLEEHPDHVFGHYMLGLARLRDGRPDAAEAAFLSALDLDGHHEKALVNLARARLQMGRAADALVPMERAVEIASESNDVHRVRGRVLAALGRRDEAEAAYRTAIALDDHDSWSMNNLGLIAIERGAFTEAIPPLARAVELDSTAALFRNNLGIALERVGDFAGAISAYEGALAIDREYERAATNLDRVQELRPTQSRESLDLASLAGRFAHEFAGPSGVTAPTAPVDGLLTGAPLVGESASSGSAFE